MKTCPHPGRLSKIAGLVLAGLLAGCASMVREPVVEARVARNPAAPEREQKTYLITCSSDLVQRWLAADRKALLALDEALEKLGYEEAGEASPPTHLIVAELGFAQRAVMPQDTNPDSIRYQNVAGMIGQGRYSQILTERNSSSGSLLMGPNGQLIPTGSWKETLRDSETRESRPAGTHDTLVLRAWDVADAGSPRIQAWEVVVLRTADHRQPSPEHVSIMLRQAAESLERLVQD